MERIKNLIPWIFFVVLTFFLFFKGCSSKNDSDDKLVVRTIKSDTVYVDKIIKVPAISERIVYLDPKPEKVIPKGKDTVRTYKKTYTDSTGIASVEVSDSINGKLLQQDVKINVKEQEVKYKEKTITNTETIKLKPSFVISAGLSTSTNGINTIYSAEVTLKNKTGWNLDLGYGTNNMVTVGVKKDIATFYKKN